MYRRSAQLGSFVLSLTLASVAALSTASAAPGEITVEVRSIAATEGDDHLDDSLADLESKLAKAFASYSHFEQVGRTSVGLAQAESASVTLPTDDELTLSYDDSSDERVKLGVSVGEELSTTLKVPPGSTFFQAGIDYREGILILAITVE